MIEAGNLSPTTSAHNGRLSNLRAIVLLGGAVRPTRLSQSIGRSMLDLPIDHKNSLLAHWMDHAARLAAICGIDKLPVRLMVDRQSPDVRSGDPFHLLLRIERDVGEYRGTGGVLRDIASDYNDDDWILVANGGQIVPGDLSKIVCAMAEKGGDATLVSHADGTPSGLMLLRCRVLRSIPPSGFVDMKEQALPRIAEEYDVRVLKLPAPSGYPVRSLREYLRGLKVLNQREDEAAAAGEDWRSSFNVIESGAEIDPTARLFDSVVMRGGRVEAGAVVVRSIVCDGTVVRKDRTAADEVLTASAEEKS